MKDLRQKTTAVFRAALDSITRLAAHGAGRGRWVGARLLAAVLTVVLLGAAAQAQRPTVQLDLQASAGGPSDPTYVYFEAGATEDYDPAIYDGIKFTNSSGLNLASFARSGEQLSINGLPPAVLAAPYSVALFVGVPQYGTYVLRVSRRRYFTSTRVSLTDALLSTSTPLDSGTVYTFGITAANTNSTGATSTRFALLFEPGPAPLPVTLLDFTAQAQPPGVALAWHTAHEQHSAYFAIERSADGQAFTEIGRVAAAGTSSQAHSYAFYDPLPLGGTSYYRLRQVDLDGSFQYSPVRVVGGQAAAGKSLVFPNPARAGATLRGLAPGERVQIFNALGQLVAVALAEASGALVLPAGLATGSYVVRSGQQTSRLLVE